MFFHQTMVNNHSTIGSRTKRNGSDEHLDISQTLIRRRVLCLYKSVGYDLSLWDQTLYDYYSKEVLD